MVFAWTRQFLMATGLFALVATGQTLNMFMKDKQLADKALESAQRTVKVSKPSTYELN